MTSTGVEAVALSCTAPGTTSLRTLRLPTGGGALRRERDRALVAGKKVDRAGGGPPQGGGRSGGGGQAEACRAVSGERLGRGLSLCLVLLPSCVAIVLSLCAGA